MNEDIYQSPLVTRYASQEMSYLFSAQFKHVTWRKLWIALAEAEAELGLPITPQQIQELKQHQDTIDFVLAAQYEKQFNHDVMAHIHTYGDQCPLARPIIHLGATSCYVTDNTDLIQMREGLTLLIKRLETVIKQLMEFAKKYSHVACLGFTHFQPAQLTTVGKRACLWIQDLLLDLKDLKYRKNSLKFLGAKGATGTQASFLALFKGNIDLVKQLDQIIALKMGFDQLFTISGQTYTRKQDLQILQTLAGVGVTSHKIGTDMRLLAHLKEIEEPFLESQVGSSAMPYKRNPILSEKLCGLARFLISLTENPLYTAATQWLERSLDDSSNRRLTIPEAFLTADAVLLTLIQLTKDLVVYPQVIQKHVENELPFMVTENLLMSAVLKGEDRQIVHEKIRQHSQAVQLQMKIKGGGNDLIERILADPTIPKSESEITLLLDTTPFIGCAKNQVDEFINNEVIPQMTS